MKRVILIIVLMLMSSVVMAMGEMPQFIDAKKASMDNSKCPLELTEAMYIPYTAAGTYDQGSYPSLTLSYKNRQDKPIKGAWIKIFVYDGNGDMVRAIGAPYSVAKFHGQNVKKDDSMRNTFDMFYRGLEVENPKIRVKVYKVYFRNGSVRYY